MVGNLRKEQSDLGAYVNASIPGLLAANRFPQLLAHFKAVPADNSPLSEVAAINQLKCGFQLLASDSSMKMKVTAQTLTLSQWILLLACIQKYRIADFIIDDANPIFLRISCASLKEAKSICISRPWMQCKNVLDMNKDVIFNRLEHFEIDYNLKGFKLPDVFLKPYESLAPNLTTLRYKNFPGALDDINRINQMLTLCPKLKEAELPLSPELLAQCQAAHPHIRWIQA